MPLTVSLILAFVAAQPAQHAPIEGLWKNPIGSAIIAVAPCGNAYCGKVVWASARGQREVAKTTSHVVGTAVLTGVKPKANGWVGKLFIPDDNIHVSAKLQLLSATQLKLTGCGLAGLICRSQIWTRTEEPLPASN
ncbi:MAG: DUF2147 domain-containing protein [Sphingomonas sp.]|nr:DUF2147 domain-containing protein [Sphingomonas sp.]